MYKVNYDHILCRYGELSTKGKNRRDFTNQLLRNIKKQLEAFPKLKYRPTYDRLYIDLNGEDGEKVAEELRHVFGLSSFSLAAKVKPDLDEIAELATALIQKEEGKTFKVFSRRHDKSFPHKSDYIVRYVAAPILKTTDFKVDVHHPDVEVIVEIRQGVAYVMMGKIPGAGGYPVGIQGKVMMMLSGGIDSPVAAYLMLKRGVQLEFIHFASPPYTSEAALQKVLDLAQTLTRYQSHIRVHVVNFTDIQLEIRDKAPESYMVTLMRRYMLKLANALSEEKQCLAIANGESLGQVASQTLESMKAIGKMDSLPILRPLLSFDKIEIIDLARKIDTYETSILPFQDSCTVFDPKNPVTRPKIDKIEYYESKMDEEDLIQKALDGIVVYDLNYHDNKEKEETFL